jgi:hypothetical protein
MEVKFRTDLTAYDFPSQRVVIQHEDGTRCEFTHAFVELDAAKEGKLSGVRVYTEHNGNHYFYQEDLEYFYTDTAMFPLTFLARAKKVYEYWKSLKGYF